MLRSIVRIQQFRVLIRVVSRATRCWVPVLIGLVLASELGFLSLTSSVVVTLVPGHRRPMTYRLVTKSHSFALTVSVDVPFSL